MPIVENLPSAAHERPIGFGRLKRKEDARFIRGKGNYLDDVRLPGMVHGGRPELPKAKKPFLLLRPWKQSGDANISFGLYTRYTVPVEEWLTRVWYMHPVVATNKLKLAWYWFVYWTWARWSCDYNFSQQDMSVMLNQRYDWPEKLSGTDAEVIQWRKLIVTKHFGGRNARFEAKNMAEVDPNGTPIAVEMDD